MTALLRSSSFAPFYPRRVSVTDHLTEHINFLSVSRQHILRRDRVARMLSRRAASVRDGAVNRGQRPFETRGTLRVELRAAISDVAGQHCNSSKIFLLGLANEFIRRRGTPAFRGLR